MAATESEREERQVAVLFLDVRNSTLILDNYGRTEVTTLLDTLFSKSRERIREANGSVDKLIGDGLMAVFTGDQPGRDAVKATLAIYDQAVPETEAENFSPIEVGIGVATGPVMETTLADIDSTVVGRVVNIAARLQGLCKKYGLSILVDAETHGQLSEEVLGESFAIRHIPEQSLRGIRQDVDTYNICDTNRLDEAYVETFSRGVQEFLNHNYDGALSEFTKAYSKHERYMDGDLLNHLTNECLEQLHGSQELFTNAEAYEEHSKTQERQSYKLQSYIRQEISMREIEPEYVLDVGCGTGKVTERFALDLFPDAHIEAIDPSSRSIAKAQADHNPENVDIEYGEARIEQYCPENQVGVFDIIYSNSAMHWVDRQDRAYDNIWTLLADDGLLAVHQGAKGSYKELHDVVIDLIEEFGYRHYFEELNPPLGLTYYTEEEMKGLLRRHGFEVVECNGVDGSAPDTIIEDFAEASLNAYCQRLENSSQREVIKEQFKKQARASYHPEDITVRRLYVTAIPNEE